MELGTVIINSILTPTMQPKIVATQTTTRTTTHPATIIITLLHHTQTINSNFRKSTVRLHLFPNLKNQKLTAQFPKTRTDSKSKRNHNKILNKAIRKRVSNISLKSILETQKDKQN